MNQISGIEKINPRNIGNNYYIQKPYNNFGSEGDINYVFEIKGWPALDNSTKYKTIFYIKKSGAKENLNELSDLEKFLIKKGFKKTEKTKECEEIDKIVHLRKWSKYA